MIHQQAFLLYERSAHVDKVQKKDVSIKVSMSQFRRRASAVPNLIVIGSTVARHKHDFDPDVVPNSGLTEVTQQLVSVDQTKMAP